MIPVIELVLDMRYDLGDMQGLNIADYELIKPINRAVNLLYGTLSERYVHAVVKRLPIVVDSTKIYSLPSDFVRVHQIVGRDDRISVPISKNPPKEAAYRIVGDELFAEEGTYTLEYYYIPAKVGTLADMLDVPESMRSWVEEIALSLYKKDMNTASGLVRQCEGILAGREISHFEDIGPVQVLGGSV